MEGRSGKRVEVTGGARTLHAVAARRETEEEVEETPSSLHEQIRGCRSGVEPAATLRPTSRAPGVGGISLLVRVCPVLG